MKELATGPDSEKSMKRQCRTGQHLEERKFWCGGQYNVGMARAKCTEGEGKYTNPAERTLNGGL